MMMELLHLGNEEGFCNRSQCLKFHKVFGRRREILNLKDGKGRGRGCVIFRDGSAEKVRKRRREMRDARSGRAQAVDGKAELSFHGRCRCGQTSSFRSDSACRHRSNQSPFGPSPACGDSAAFQNQAFFWEGRKEGGKCDGSGESTNTK